MSCKDGARISVFVAFGVMCILVREWRCLSCGCAFFSAAGARPRISIFVAFRENAPFGRQKIIWRYDSKHLGAADRGVSVNVASRARRLGISILVAVWVGYVP